MAWKVSNGWLVEASSGIDINGIDDFICTFGTLRTIGALILARWREEETTIGSKGETTEKGGIGLIRIYASISNASTGPKIQIWIWGVFHRPNGGQRHRGSRRR